MVDSGGIENVKFLPSKKSITARSRRIQHHPGNRCHFLNDAAQVSCACIRDRMNRFERREISKFLRKEQIDSDRESMRRFADVDFKITFSIRFYSNDLQTRQILFPFVNFTFARFRTKKKKNDLVISRRKALVSTWKDRVTLFHGNYPYWPILMLQSRGNDPLIPRESLHHRTLAHRSTCRNGLGSRFMR